MGEEKLDRGDEIVPADVTDITAGAGKQGVTSEDGGTKHCGTERVLGSTGHQNSGIDGQDGCAVRIPPA